MRLTFRWCCSVREAALACELMSSAETASSAFRCFRRVARRVRTGPSPSDMCMLARASCPMACPSLLAAFLFPCTVHGADAARKVAGPSRLCVKKRSHRVYLGPLTTYVLGENPLQPSADTADAADINLAYTLKIPMDHVPAVTGLLFQESLLTARHAQLAA